MKKFSYKAKNNKGEVLSGEIETSIQSEAAKILISKQLFPIEIVEIKERKFKLENIPFFSFLDSVPKKKKAVAIRQFATLVRSGLSIIQSLETMTQESGDKKLKDTFASILQEVEGGSALSAAFSKHPKVFSGIDISLIKAGERSGNLDKVLDRMANQLEKDASLISKIRGALIYPAIVLMVAGGVISIMIIYLVPKLVDLYADFEGELPFITKMMIWLSDLLVHFWWALILIFIALVSGFITYIKSEKGKVHWDTLKIKTPIIKELLIKIYMARFTRIMGTLLGSGVSVVESITITSDAIGSEVYRREILKIAESVRQGKSLSAGMRASEIFPSVSSRMIKVGEETGEIDNMLNNLANYYEEEVDNIVKSIATIIEPVMIVVMGGVTLLILVGIMGPIYQIAQYIF